MAIKRYSKQEPIVFLWVMFPYIIFMNLLIFGTCILSSFGLFLTSFLYSAVYFFGIYAIFGTVAVRIQSQFPAAGDLFKRISVLLPFFYLMNIGAVKGAFILFEKTNLFACKPIPYMIWYTILYGCVWSTVITFINEGMANWERWKDSLAEKEKLKNAYQRSRLFGLKGQINPHFLFNCFNSLSGLIHENEAEAERFLDEMTKVHRYLLRSDDEYLVPVEEELKFAQSYLYLTKARFGMAINTSFNLTNKSKGLLVPPLSMQVILENIIYTNALHKKEPLTIQINFHDDKELIITHTVHEKTILSNLNHDEGLQNLINKYKLLNEETIKITDEGLHRTIVLPLFQKNILV